MHASDIDSTVNTAPASDTPGPSADVRHAETLAARLASLTEVKSARVTSPREPLVMLGRLDDGRWWRFHARFGHATLFVENQDTIGPDDNGRAETRRCLHSLGVENTDKTVQTFADLLDRHTRMDMLRAGMPDATDLKLIDWVTVHDAGPGGDDKDHEVHLVVAYGGDYWFCGTCEAQGMDESIPGNPNLDEIHDNAERWHASL